MGCLKLVISAKYSKGSLTWLDPSSSPWSIIQPCQSPQTWYGFYLGIKVVWYQEFHLDLHFQSFLGPTLHSQSIVLSGHLSSQQLAFYQLWLSYYVGGGCLAQQTERWKLWHCLPKDDLVHWLKKTLLDGTCYYFIWSQDKVNTWLWYLQWCDAF